MKPITDLQASYMAGLFDGEGNISISKKKPVKSHHNPTFGLEVTLTNTNTEMLRWVRNLLGGGQIKPKPRSQKNWKLCFQLVFLVDEIESLLKRILPFMIVRKRQAELMLEFLDTRAYHGGSHPMTVDEFIEKDLIFEELRTLNKRGIQIED